MTKECLASKHRDPQRCGPFDGRHVAGLLGLLLLMAPARALGQGDPLAVNPSADAALEESHMQAAWKAAGTRATFRLYSRAKEHSRIVMRFDFKGNAARPCRVAVLRLTTDKCWPNTKSKVIRVHRLLRPFDERWVSWGHSFEEEQWLLKGGDMDPRAMCGRRLTDKDRGEGKTIDIDVTPLVQGWQMKRVPNYGLLLTLENDSDVNAHFHSREAGNAAQRPQLLLYYAARAPKNPDMVKPGQLKPLGTFPRIKTEIVTKAFNLAKVGADYTARLKARGGIAPYTWKVTGLPEGLKATQEGAISGRPAKAGRFKIVLIVTGADRKSARANVELEVKDASAKLPDPPKPKAEPGKKVPAGAPDGDEEE